MSVRLPEEGRGNLTFFVYLVTPHDVMGSDMKMEAFTAFDCISTSSFSPSPGYFHGVCQMTERYITVSWCVEYKASTETWRETLIESNI